MATFKPTKARNKDAKSEAKQKRITKSANKILNPQSEKVVGTNLSFH